MYMKFSACFGSMGMLICAREREGIDQFSSSFCVFADVHWAIFERSPVIEGTWRLPRTIRWEESRRDETRRDLSLPFGAIEGWTFRHRSLNWKQSTDWTIVPPVENKRKIRAVIDLDLDWIVLKRERKIFSLSFSRLSKKINREMNEHCCVSTITEQSFVSQQRQTDEDRLFFSMKNSSFARLHWRRNVILCFHLSSNFIFLIKDKLIERRKRLCGRVDSFGDWILAIWVLCPIHLPISSNEDVLLYREVLLRAERKDCEMRRCFSFVGISVPFWFRLDVKLRLLTCQLKKASVIVIHLMIERLVSLLVDRPEKNDWTLVRLVFSSNQMSQFACPTGKIIQSTPFSGRKRKKVR